MREKAGEGKEGHWGETRSWETKEGRPEMREGHTEANEGKTEDVTGKEEGKGC